MGSSFARSLWAGAKKLAMGFALIVLFSAILLFSDLAHRKTSSPSPADPNALAADRNFKAVIVAMAPGVTTDLCADGMLEGLRQSGIIAKKNLEVVRADAQGEMINIPAILQNYDNSDVDLIMTITTPCLAGACNKVKHKPVVFTCVTDPIAAGAGKSRADAFAICYRRRQLSAGGPHSGPDAETRSRPARGGNHVQPGGSQFGEGKSRWPAKYFENAA